MNKKKQKKNISIVKIYPAKTFVKPFFFFWPPSEHHW